MFIHLHLLRRKRQRIEDLPPSHSLTTMLHNYGAGQSKLKGEHAMARAMVRDGDTQPAIREFMNRASSPDDSHLTRFFQMDKVFV